MRALCVDAQVQSPHFDGEVRRQARSTELRAGQSALGPGLILTRLCACYLLVQIPLWHHKSCLFKRETITNEALLVGLGNIRPEDVKELKAKCGGVAAAVSAAAAGAGAGKNVVILPPSLAGERFQVDYAKSGRSGCKHCGEKIDQDELRVGKMVQSQVSTARNSMQNE